MSHELIQSWLENVFCVQKLSIEIEDIEMHRETHRFMSRGIKTTLLLRFFQDSYDESADYDLRSDFSTTHIKYNVTDWDTRQASSLIRSLSHEYLFATYGFVGLGKSDFEIDGITTNELICERSSTIPPLYDTIYSWLEDYRGF